MPVILPYELHSLIIQRARGKESLLSLSLCCSSFRDVAQGILFQYPVGISSPDKLHSLIRSIISSPERIGPMLRVFEYRHGKENPDVPGGSYNDLAKALRAMINLKHLWLSDAWRYPISVVDGCTFRLESFHMHCGTNAFLLHFLPTQPGLKHLGVDTDRDPDPDEKKRVVEYSEEDDVEDEGEEDEEDDDFYEPPAPLVIPPDVCPHLESIFGAPHNVVQFFEDNRPIKRLEWEERGLPPAFPPIIRFPLEYLKIYPTVLGMGLTGFGVHFASLTTAEITEILPMSSRVISNCVAFASRIPNLSGLILSSHRAEVSWDQEMALQFFKACRKLEHVDIQMSRPRSYYKRFYRPDEDDEEEGMEYDFLRLPDVHEGVTWVEDKWAYLKYRQ